MDERKEIEEEHFIEVNRKLTRKEVKDFVKIIAQLQPIPGSSINVDYEKRRMIDSLLELL